MVDGLLHYITSIASSIPCPSSWNSIAAMADREDGVVAAAPAAAGGEGVLGSSSKQDEILSSQAVDDGKWRNGVKSKVLDCPVEAAWDLVSDWGRWSWYTPPDSIEHAAGEHRKAGCVRVLRYPTMWLSERALVIDNDQRFLSYAIDDNDAFGGIQGFVGRTQFQATSDGKTLIPYWNYEIEPLENFTPETFHTTLESILKIVFDDLEKEAQRLAAGLDPAVDSTTTETSKQ